MKPARTARPPRQMLFLLMCLIWGATWIAMKTGLAVVPPAFFAGTRFVAAGLLLLAMHAGRGGSLALERQDWPRTAAATLLMVTLTYPLLFWGALYVSSGLAAIVDLAFLPVALLAFGIVLREERATPRKLLTLALGVAGLLLLFGPKALEGAQGSLQELLACAAIVLSALVYALGSVVARPLLRGYPPLLIAGHTLFAGGLVTLVGALLFEPGAAAAASLVWGWPAWAAWTFLVLAGSVAAYTIYLRLVLDWGPSRAGAYCFVSPVIAVALGVWVLGERVTILELAGMSVMLGAAWLSVRGSGASGSETHGANTEKGHGISQRPFARPRAPQGLRS